MNRMKIGWTFAFIGAAAIGIAFWDKEDFWYWFLPGFVPFMAFLWGVSAKCPECGRWWASIHRGSELLDRWQETKDVKREDVTRDRKGKEIARTK